MASRGIWNVHKHDPLSVERSKTQTKEPDSYNIRFGTLTICIADDAFERLLAAMLEAKQQSAGAGASEPKPEKAKLGARLF